MRVDSAPMGLGGLRQRAVLAVLALHANEVVSTERLVDLLWGERPPASAVHAIQVCVSNLRSTLGPAAKRLATKSPGYVLELDAAELDAPVCQRLYEDARLALGRGDATGAAERLRRAESLWRGPPLADFTYEPFAQAAIARLEELRISCREELIDAELALGQHAEVIARLEELVREQPYRERLREQLMLALYRSGRQVDALEVFHDARRVLVEELAVEPGDALRELEQAILRQDPGLAAPAPLALEPSLDQAPGTTESPPGRIDDAPLVATADPSSRARTRRMATILVAKLTADRPADPEVLERAVAATREAAETIVGRHGGVAVAAVAGELVWVFGVPMTREDDALRAMRAADEIRSEVIAASATDRRLSVRLALASGEVVAASAADVFGEPLEHSLSLAGAAPAGEILLDRTTRRAVATVVETETTLAGQAWRLVALVADAVIPRQAPMVGRDRELEMALEIFARAAYSGEAQLVTVIGDAGIGKSRLAQELAERLTEWATVLTGHCLSYGEGVAFWPWREALMQATGGASHGAVCRLLGDEPDAELVAGIIATTLQLAPAESVGEQVPWAFRRLLEVLAARRPVLIVLEDGHWAEPPLLDLVDYLVDWLRAPVLVLCLARPDLLEIRPSWGGGHARKTSIVLGPLRDDDARALLQHQLGGRGLTRAQTNEILRTAEGNPLFVEELLQARAEQPWLDRERQIPATIQRLLASRLDRLGPGERAVIERAALIGREFWADAVVELLPPEARGSVPSHLRALVHRGLIRPARSFVAGEEQLSFHHTLIRDVAYHSSPKNVRADLHERFAEWLIVHNAGYDEFIGYHFEQAYRYRHELDPRERDALTLAARGAEYLLVAGRRASSLGDAMPAARLLESAAELFDASGSRRPDVLLDLGSVLSEIDVPRAQPALLAAYDQALESGEEAIAARALIALSYRRALIDRSVPVAEMLSVAEQAVKVFSRLGDDGGIAHAWHHVAMVHWFQSRCADMEEALERALTHADRAGDQRTQARVLGYLARATVTGPRPVDDGLRRCQAILLRAGEDVGLIAATNTMMSVLDAMRGRFAEARERWQGSRTALEAVGLTVTVAKLQMYRAFVEQLAGTPENAEPELNAAYAVLERSGERGHVNTIAGLMARLLWAQGRHRESARYCQICEESAIAGDLISQILWRGTKAKLMASTGAGDEAAGLATSAVALAEGTDFLLVHANALSDRAEVLAMVGADDAADRAAARELFTRKGILLDGPIAASRPATPLATPD